MCELELMELYISLSISISIELNFAGLIEQMKSVNTKIDPIERLYDLRTRVRNGGKITDGDWNSKLIKAAHQGYVMGWDDKSTKKAIQNFSLITIINEIFCGKTTPLTLKEAHELPEWET